MKPIIQHGNLPFLASLLLFFIAFGVIEAAHGFPWAHWVWQGALCGFVGLCLWWWSCLIKQRRASGEPSKVGRTGFALGLFACVMFGFSYVMVPFF